MYLNFPSIKTNVDMFKKINVNRLIMGSDLVVGDIMKNKIVISPTNASIKDVAKLMKKYDIGSIIITDANDEKDAVGIITERDIVWKIVAQGKSFNVRAETIMSKPIRVISVDTTLEDASNIMRKYDIKRLPVVNKKKELVGIISETDITRVFPSVVDIVEEKMSI